MSNWQMITLGLVCIVAVAPGLKAEIDPQSSAVMEHCHWYSCDRSQMWKGIVLDYLLPFSSATLRIAGNSAVEDAQTAIKASNSIIPTGGGYVLVSDSVVFNRNNIDIDISLNTYIVNLYKLY